MNLNLNTKAIMGQLRQLAALIGVFISVSNDLHLPQSVRGILLAVSGLILAAEHVVDGLSTPTSVTVPTGAALVSTGQVQTGAALVNKTGTPLA